MLTAFREMRRLSLQSCLFRIVCPQCSRTFAATSIAQAGHNKWSKVKHDKSRKDALKGAERAPLVQALTLHSKMYGPDPNTNHSLAQTIAACKKISMPKNVIDQAIARGQGRSLSGTALETMKFEIMMPPSAAFILDVETDNRLRALQEIGLVISKSKGRTTSTEFFFSRRGRVVFEKHETLGVDDIMDKAIDLGTEDMEADAEGNLMVWSQPAQTMQLAQGLSREFGLKILHADIIWDPNEETCSTVDSVEDIKRLEDFVTALAEMPEVQAIFSNAVKGEGVPEAAWEAFAEKLDS